MLRVTVCLTSNDENNVRLLAVEEYCITFILHRVRTEVSNRTFNGFHRLSPLRRKRNCGYITLISDRLKVYESK